MKKTICLLLAALMLFAIVFTITTINLMVSRKAVFYN